jgi:uncharacterized protein YozE (UPF0346 family)
MIKASKLITIICVIITTICVLIIAINVIVESYKADQIEQLESEHKDKTHYDPEEIQKLQYEDDQNAEIQYELICQMIEENSDYYVNISKKFISTFKEYAATEPNAYKDSFSLSRIRSKFENDYNHQLLGLAEHCYIMNEIGITYVDLEYPISINGVYYSHGYIDYYYYYCSVIFIPDEYMDEEIITTLNTKIYGKTLKNIKDNLFIAKGYIIGD